MNKYYFLSFFLSLSAFSADISLVNSGDAIQASKINEVISKVNLIEKTPQFIKFTSGSGIYTPAVGVKYLRVKMVGGGGGGGGSGSQNPAIGGVGGAGGNTTLGSNLLVAYGGLPGHIPSTQSTGGLGGGALINTGAFGTSVTGSSGSLTSATASVAYSVSGAGGNSHFGGAGSASYSTGISASVNSGSGGAGGGGALSATVGGNGGGAGGYVEALIPASVISSSGGSFSYAVGVGGSGGNPGTQGNYGGNGGSGIIIIEEHFY